MSYRALIFVALLAGTAHAENWEAAYGLGGGGEAIGGDFYGGGIVHAHVERRVIDRLAVSITGELAGAADYNTPTRRAGIYRGLAGVDITVFAREGTFMPRIMTSIGTGTNTAAGFRSKTATSSAVSIRWRSGSACAAKSRRASPAPPSRSSAPRAKRWNQPIRPSISGSRFIWAWCSAASVLRT